MFARFNLPLWFHILVLALLTALIVDGFAALVVQPVARPSSTAALSTLSTPRPAADTLFMATVMPLPTVDRSTPLLRGKYNYNAYCAHCHGYNGEGESDMVDPNKPDELGYLPVPRHDRLGHTWLHPDQLLLASIRQGLPNPLYRFQMPAFAPEILSDQEIQEIVLYIKQWWTADQRASQVASTQRLGEVLAKPPGSG